MRQLSTRWQGRIPPCFAGVRAGGMIRSHRALHLGISAPLTAHGEARASDTRGGGVRHRDAPLCRFARVEGALQSGGWPLPKSPGRTHARVPRLRRSRTTSAIVPRTRCYTVSWKSTSSRSIRRWVSRASRYRRSCTRSSSATCAVVGSSTGRLSQTKYYLSYSPATITIIRRHHPLEGRHLDVLSAGRATVVVSLTDGSSLKLPRRWTDADGIACTDLSGDSPFTLHGLRELLRLFIALRERARGAGSEHDAKIDSPHDGARRVDVQATTIGVHRREAARETVGGVARTGEERGHAALCPIDGSNRGATHSPAERKAGGGQ